MSDNKTINTIGVLTSGGDAPGMNAAVRAVVRTALSKGMEVFGVRRGYQGLLENDMFVMNIRSVSEIIQRGGTTLLSARSKDFATKVGVKQAVQNCRENGIDALVCIGGDGTFKGAKCLCEAGIPCIGVPATIDNDISCTDYTIGFDTAMNTAVEMIDKLRDTTKSHSRCSLVEVMGHEHGVLAANIGLACGALVTLVPEVKPDLEKDVIDRMLYTQRTGKSHFIIVTAEGACNSSELAEYIENHTGIETRVTVLGHVQRGGTPTARDREMATRMGYKAVELLEQGKSSRVVCYKNGILTDFDIEEALNMEFQLDMDAFKISNMISL